MLRVSDDQFVLFYSAKRRGSGQQCIGRATASSAHGPFVDNFSQPLVCDRQGATGYWSIDPSIFVDVDGQRYLLWRQDNGSHAHTTVSARRLDQSGASFAAGSVERTILAKDTGSWEDPVLENPELVRVRDGQYVLFYSANRWETSDYGVGYAVCSSPLGPCEKKTTDGPWLESAFAMAGPGGLTVFDGPDDEPWAAWHAWDASQVGPESGGGRKLWVGKLAFAEDGTPRLIEATYTPTCTGTKTQCQR